MKKTSILLFALITVITSCTQKSDENIAGDNARIEITPFKITEVILKDTTQVKTAYANTDSGRMTISEYNYSYGRQATYLDQKQFSIMKNAIWILVKSPNSQVYFQLGGTETKETKPVNHQQLRDKICLCDSIIQSSFNATGEKTVTAFWACDSTSIMQSVNRIVFYESWYFNPKNNMIERDLLGYAVQSFREDKQVYKELFMVFKDEASVRKAKKYYFDLDY